MTSLAAGDRDRLVEFWRDVEGEADGFNETVKTPKCIGRLYARRLNQSSQERIAAAQNEASEVTRFTVPWCALSSGLSATDRLRYNGIDYNITSVQEVGRRQDIEVAVRGRVP